MYSRFFDRQIKRDAALYVVSVLEISEETNGIVKASDDNHGGVQHAVPSPQVLRGLHLVLERQDDADAFKGVYGCSKE